MSEKFDYSTLLNVSRIRLNPKYVERAEVLKKVHRNKEDIGSLYTEITQSIWMEQILPNMSDHVIRIFV